MSVLLCLALPIPAACPARSDPIPCCSTCYPVLHRAGRLIVSEDRAVGSVPWKVYGQLALRMGLPLTLLIAGAWREGWKRLWDEIRGAGGRTERARWQQGEGCGYLRPPAGQHMRPFGFFFSSLFALPRAPWHPLQLAWWLGRPSCCLETTGWACGPAKAPRSSSRCVPLQGLPQPSALLNSRSGTCLLGPGPGRDDADPRHVGWSPAHHWLSQCRAPPLSNSLHLQLNWVWVYAIITGESQPVAGGGPCMVASHPPHAASAACELARLLLRPRSAPAAPAVRCPATATTAAPPGRPTHRRRHPDRILFSLLPLLHGGAASGHAAAPRNAGAGGWGGGG